MIEAASLHQETPRKGRFSFGAWLRLAGAVLFALGWLLPNHYLPWVSFHSEALAFAGLLAWCAGDLAQPAPRNRIPLIACAPIALLAVVWLQWAFGLVWFAGEAWMATLYLGSLAAAIAVGYRWRLGEGGWQLLLECVVAPLVAAAFVSSLLSLVQWFSLDEELGIFIANIGNFGRPFANMAQPNLLGTFLLMGLPGLLWMVRARVIARPFAAIAAAFIIVAIVLTQSRAAFLSAGITAAWLVLRRRHVLADRAAWREIWIALAAAAALGLALWGLHTLLGLGGESAHRQITGSAGRWVMWAQMLDGVRQAPLAGYGWHSSYAAQAVGSAHFPGEQSARFAHDVFIDMLCWFGIPLGVAICAMVVAWWWLRMKAAADEAATLAIAVCLPVLVHSLVEFPFAYLFFLIPVGVIAGALEAQRPAPRDFGVRALPVAAFVLALGTLGAWTAAEYMPAEADFRIIRFESLRVGTTPPEAQPPQFSMLTQLGALSKVGHAKPQPGAVTDRDLALARRIARKYPWAPLSLKYAIYLEAAGRHDDALRELQLISDVYGPLALVAAREEFNLSVQQWPTAPARR